MEDEDTAMDTHDLKLSIPETSADGARSGSPESGVSTPRYSEHQSGSKRLRTKDGWEEVEGGSDPETGGPNRDDEPGTSAGMLNVNPVEVGQLVLRTKAVCSELADVIVRLARERYAHEPPPRLTILNRAFPLGRGRLKISLLASRSSGGPRPALTPAPVLDARSTWTDSKEADIARKRELCDQLRTIQRYATDTTRAVPETQRRTLRLFFFQRRATRRARVWTPPSPTARHITSRIVSFFTRTTRD